MWKASLWKYATVDSHRVRCKTHPIFFGKSRFRVSAVSTSGFMAEFRCRIIDFVRDWGYNDFYRFMNSFSCISDKKR